MQSWASPPNRSTAVLVRLSRSCWILQHLPLVLGAAAPQALLLLLQRAERHFFCSNAPSATSRWIYQQLVSRAAAGSSSICRSSLAQQRFDRCFLAGLGLHSTHSAASWPVLSSTAPRSLLPRRSWAPQRFDRCGALFSASVSRFDHSLAGPWQRAQRCQPLDLPAAQGRKRSGSDLPPRFVKSSPALPPSPESSPVSLVSSPASSPALFPVLLPSLVSRIVPKLA